MLADAEESASRTPRSTTSRSRSAPRTARCSTRCNGTLADLKTHFPDYAGQGYELAGFVWFQGWNDMINADATAEYTANLAHFIRDVRKDLKAPKLPFVIGQMGVDGDEPGRERQEVQGRPGRRAWTWPSSRATWRW